MKITERAAGDITILDVEGRIVFGDGDEDFCQAVTRAIQSGRTRFLINMAGVPFVDSAGLSQIVRTFVTSGNRGGQLKLLNVTRRVQELLAMTRLDTVLELFDSEEKALASFGATKEPSGS